MILMVFILFVCIFISPAHFTLYIFPIHKSVSFLQITDAVEKLKALKLELGDEQPNTSAKIVLKTAKGARDFHPDQMAIREKVLEKIINVFKCHGAVTIDTPVFELKDVLTGIISFSTFLELRNLT